MSLVRNGPIQLVHSPVRLVGASLNGAALTYRCEGCGVLIQVPRTSGPARAQ